MLAGISVEYYTRLERGTTSGASEEVLEGIVRALQLDEAERSHLFDLVRAANRSRPTRARPTHERVRPTVQHILDALVGVPAYVRNGRLDILSANRLGAALYSPVLEDTAGPPNMSRFIFLNPRAAEFFEDWDDVASDAVAILRAAAGRDPYDKRLSDLIGELSDAQRGVRSPLGRAQCEVPPNRNETTPSPHRWSPRPCVRSPRVARRLRTTDPGLHSRTGLTDTKRPRPSCQLGFDGDADDRGALNLRRA